MKRSSVPIDDATLLLGAGAAILLFILIKGGIKGAAAAAAGAATHAVVDAAGGVITGADAALGVDGAMGFPPGFAGTNDPAVTRYLMDHPDGGYATAVYRSTASALYGATQMDAGTGTAPAVGSPLYELFPPPVNTGSVSGSW